MNSRGLCTETIQFTSCNQPYCYALDLVDRGVCRPSNGARCGEGMAKLNWQCVDYSGKVVDMNKCPYIQRNSEPCQVPCPGECAYDSTWSEWSGCESVCNKRYVSEKRVRDLVGNDASGSCKPQIEQRDCPMDDCYITMWELGIYYFLTFEKSCDNVSLF